MAVLVAVLLSACTPSADPEPPPAPVGTQAVTQAMAVARAGHTATPLPDGRVLIAGGCTTGGCGGTPAGRRSEIFDPSLGGFVAGPELVQARVGHTATRLADGRVLLAGGYPDERRAPLTEAELYDPATGRFTATGSMSVGRGSHTATLLRDGRVLIAGGVSGTSALSTVEIYDLSGRFQPVAPMPSPRAIHAAALLGTGDVLVVGGQSRPGHGNALVDTALVYSVTTNTWRETGPLRQPKYKLAAAPLPGGGALVIGGQIADNPAARLRETEIFDPITLSFRAGPDMSEPRYKISEAVAVLPDGRFVIAGNMGADVYTGNGFTPLAVPPGGPERQQPAVAPLPDGRVLVTGGYNEQTQPTASAIVVAPG